MRTTILALALMGCDNTPADRAMSEAPPPVAFPEMDATSFRPGQMATVSVTNVQPGEDVHLIRASNVGAGMCITSINTCLDIQDGMQYITRVDANPMGAAHFTFRVPDTLPVGTEGFFQAVVIRRGQGIKSQPLYVMVDEPDVPVDLCADVQEVFDASCVGCHGGPAPLGELDLEDAESIVGVGASGAFLPLVDPGGDRNNSYLWHKVAGTQTSVAGGGGQMPPSGMLSAPDLDAVAAWVDAGGDCVEGGDTDTDDGGGGVDAGPDTPVMRRLNRTEYDNTVRDLLDTPLKPAAAFPLDDAIGGFDNNGDALTTSALHVEEWEVAAELLAEDFVERYAISDGSNLLDTVFQAEDMTAPCGGVSGSTYNIWSSCELSIDVDVPADGTYELSAFVQPRQGGPDLAQMALRVDGLEVYSTELAGTDFRVESTEVELTAGTHSIGVAFLNDYYDAPNSIDRNLIADWVQIAGPVSGGGTPGDSPYAAGISCDPGASGTTTCLTDLLTPIMANAYRRPLDTNEVSSLVGVLTDLIDNDGLTYGEAVVGGLEAILLSPNFLYRPEYDHNGADTTAQFLDDYELATRLSYFLWSSMPDAELFQLAEAGQLQDPAMLDTQVRRMLSDAKAESMYKDFAGQWLWLRGIPDSSPDPVLYPDFDEGLRTAFDEEARRLFMPFINGDRDLTGLLTQTTREVTPELASFYGYTGGVPDGWSTVDLAANDRYGILTNGGLLAALSNPTSSNPVRRGKYIMGQLLCDEPGDPPPGAIESFEPGSGQGSLREQFEDHRSDPVCASCHVKMDPLGFSLEHYGPAGEWRATDDIGYPVDDVGVLPDGRTFEGPAGLGDVLSTDPLFPICVSEKLYTFALGAAPTGTTYPYVLDARDDFVDGGMRFEDLAVSLVTSDAFRMRGE